MADTRFKAGDIIEVIKESNVLNVGERTVVLYVRGNVFYFFVSPNIRNTCYGSQHDFTEFWKVVE